MPPKFTVPSYNVFLCAGLVNTFIGLTGLILLKTSIFSISAQDFMLPALDKSVASSFALEQIFN
ncbi:hypothetical protein HDU98_008300, partial [Podochytrium sp. JEL0797]